MGAEGKGPEGSQQAEKVVLKEKEERREAVRQIVGRAGNKSSGYTQRRVNKKSWGKRWKLWGDENLGVRGSFTHLITQLVEQANGAGKIL